MRSPASTTAGHQRCAAVDPGQPAGSALRQHSKRLGFRHAGVLTKLDIMDRGTDASAILRNEVVPLRLGYIGLVCRSQADIAARRSMRDARAAEQAFFEGHPEYHEVGDCALRAHAGGGPAQAQRAH